MQEIQQIEDMEQILHLIDLHYPLPRLGGWAASADFIKILYQEILALLRRKKAPVILEMGSGVSTILIAYLLKKYAPEALFISLDHDIEYMQKSRYALELHDLHSSVHLLYAPLQKYLLGEEVWLWYKTAQLFELLGQNRIDLLSVDGPPMNTQSLARYPVLPIMRERLSNDWVLVLDDAAREEEQAIVQRWKQEFRPLCEDFVQTQKGTAIVRPVQLRYSPKISICIPTYNRKEYVAQALQSALDQKYENLEIIVVDDGSSDGTQEFVKSFEDSRIRYFRNEANKGRPYTRNRCIDEASGEFLLWLDDDDVLPEDIVDEYVKLLQEYSDTQIFYGALKRLQSDEMIVDPQDFYQNNKTLLNILLTGGCPLPNPGTMVKKELYERFGKYDEEFLRAQDYEFWSRVVLKASIKKYNGVSCYYRVHENNISAGSVVDVDTSYESKIVRKSLQKDILFEVFDYMPSLEYAFAEIGEYLKNLQDYCNALYYYDLAKRDKSKALFIALLADKSEYAKKLLKEVDKKQETFAKLIQTYDSLRKKCVTLIEKKRVERLRQFIEPIETLLPNSWLYHYVMAHVKEDEKAVQKHARSSFICNPLSLESAQLMQKIGFSESEIQKITQRLTESLNPYEKDKSRFWGELK